MALNWCGLSLHVYLKLAITANQFKMMSLLFDYCNTIIKHMYSVGIDPLNANASILCRYVNIFFKGRLDVQHTHSRTDYQE